MPGCRFTLRFVALFNSPAAASGIETPSVNQLSELDVVHPFPFQPNAFALFTDPISSFSPVAVLPPVDGAVQAPTVFRALPVRPLLVTVTVTSAVLVGSVGA